jgi:hypothetical protein
VPDVFRKHFADTSNGPTEKRCTLGAPARAVAIELPLVAVNRLSNDRALRLMSVIARFARSLATRLVLSAFLAIPSARLASVNAEGAPAAGNANETAVTIASPASTYLRRMPVPFLLEYVSGARR